MRGNTNQTSGCVASWAKTTSTSLRAVRTPRPRVRARTIGASTATAIKKATSQARGVASAALPAAHVEEAPAASSR